MEKELLAKVVQSFKIKGGGTGKTKAMFDQVFWVANRGISCWVVSSSRGESNAFRNLWLRKYATSTERTNIQVMPLFMSLEEFAGNLPDPHIKNDCKVFFDPSLLIQLLTELLQPPKKEEPQKTTCPHCGLTDYGTTAGIHKKDCKMVTDFLDGLPGPQFVQITEEGKNARDNLMRTFYPDDAESHAQKKEEPKVHVCSAAVHGVCLTIEELDKFIPVGWYSVHTKGRLIPFAPKESDPELALSVSQMKELFDNLVMEGFTKGEAARVVGIVAHG